MDELLCYISKNQMESEAHFLKYFGTAREGFDGLRLLKMTEQIPDEKAENALNFLIQKDMDIKMGIDPKKHFTKEMVLFQMKVYYAILELKKKFVLDFMGIQDQLDWIERMKWAFHLNVTTPKHLKS
jgi:hypothetical protein